MIGSPSDSSIGCESRLMKRRSQVRIPSPPILVWTCQKKKKKKEAMIGETRRVTQTIKGVVKTIDREFLACLLGAGCLLLNA
jgi:hypothetical protein